MTGEDLGYKPDVVPNAKFEYSPLGQVFNKGLDVSKKNEVLLKRLKNIEGKTEQQLDLIRDQEENQLDLIGKIDTDKTKRIGFYDKENKKAVELVNKINKVIRENKNKKFVCTDSNGAQYDFNQYRDVNQFGNELYNEELSIDDAINEQYNMKILTN